MIHPSIYNDVDGRYRGRDDKIHNTDGAFDYYTVFSLWDTYRALHPLLTILDKKRTNDFINTFIKQYEQGGRLPIWELSSNETNCMIGYHVVSVIWDAYNKGIRDYDVEKAYEAMTSIATHYIDYEGEGLEMKLKESAREGAADADALESYNKYGYVRSDDSHESVSKTLEYAYDDWCIAQMAKALGKEQDYAYYEKRSHYWMNVYDPTTGFMRARKNGCLYEPFSPYTVDNNYTEANAWQYSFYVPHDIPSLFNLHGSFIGFEKSLNDLISAREKTEGREQSDITGLIGQYAHGNEPSHHIAYLYNYIQYLVIFLK
jgi:predicted alpha-1,2-mannosidase